MSLISRFGSWKHCPTPYFQSFLKPRFSTRFSRVKSYCENPLTPLFQCTFSKAGSWNTFPPHSFQSWLIGRIFPFFRNCILRRTGSAPQEPKANFEFEHNFLRFAALTPEDCFCPTYSRVSSWNHFSAPRFPDSRIHVSSPALWKIADENSMHPHNVQKRFLVENFVKKITAGVYFFPTQHFLLLAGDTGWTFLLGLSLGANLAPLFETTLKRCLLKTFENKIRSRVGSCRTKMCPSTLPGWTLENVLPPHML